MTKSPKWLQNTQYNGRQHYSTDKDDKKVDDNDQNQDRYSHIV